MLYPRSDVASVSVSAAHGGCTQVHTRPAPGGVPVKVWQLECPPCETWLRNDPLYSSTLSEIPETYDEGKTREDFEKRRVFDQQGIMAMAMAKIAGVDLPDTLRLPVGNMSPHVAVLAGTVVCDAGHDNEAGSKFCAECGSALREPLRPSCPNGHEVAAKAKFCAECGHPMTPALEAVPAPAPAPAGRAKPLKDWRAEDLKALARERGLDDTGTRRDVLIRLRAAA